MDIWGALALIFAGTFFATLLVAVFYWQAVRPRLIDLARQSTPPPQPDFSTPVEELQAAINVLSETVVRHSALVSRLPTSFEVRGPAGDPAGSGEALMALRDAQAEGQNMLVRLERQLADVRAAQNTLVDSWRAQGEALITRRGPSDGERLHAMVGDLGAAQAQIGSQVAVLHDQVAGLAARIDSALAEWRVQVGALAARPDASPASMSGELHGLLTDLSAAQAQTVARLDAQEQRDAAQQKTIDATQSLVAALNAAQLDLIARSVQQGENLSEQRDKLTTTQTHSASLSASQLDLIARIAQQAEQLTRLEAQTETLLDVLRRSSQAPVPASPVVPSIRRGRPGGVARSLRRVQRRMMMQSRRAKAARRNTSSMLAALSRSEARLARHEDTLQSLRERLDMTLEGQQTHTELLRDISDREIPTRTVIREEKIMLHDRLRDIRGIGPVFSGILHEHGVHSFRQLAELTPQELRALVDLPRWRAIKAESWIEQAQLLASQKGKAEESL